MYTVMDNLKKEEMLTKAQLMQYVVSLQSKTLSKEDENEVFSKIWGSIKPYVVRLLNKKYQGLFSSHMEEMFQEISLAIWKDIDKYDPNRGAFLTFVHPIIMHAAQEWANMYLYGATIHYGENIKKIKKCLAQLTANGEFEEEEISPLTISQKTGISLHTVNECLAQIRHANPVYFDAEPYLLDILDKSEESDDPYCSSPEYLAVKLEEKTAIHNLMARLSEESRMALSYSFGFITGEPLPDSKVAEIMDISKVKVRRLIQEAQRQIKGALEREDIFASRYIRTDIEEANKRIAFISSTTSEENEEAMMFMQLNDLGF